MRLARSPSFPVLCLRFRIRDPDRLAHFPPPESQIWVCPGDASVSVETLSLPAERSACLCSWRVTFPQVVCGSRKTKTASPQQSFHQYSLSAARNAAMKAGSDEGGWNQNRNQNRKAWAAPPSYVSMRRDYSVCVVPVETQSSPGTGGPDPPGELVNACLDTNLNPTSKNLSIGAAASGGSGRLGAALRSLISARYELDRLSAACFAAYVEQLICSCAGRRSTEPPGSDAVIPSDL